jgi:hypothetical protein
VLRFRRIILGLSGALLIAPMVVAVQALPANAATGKLLVTTLDRNGQAVSANITVSQGNGLPTWTTSGTTLSVADGQHAVLAGIEQTVNGQTVGTLAETMVTVSGTGTTKVTLDARQGHLVNVTLNGKPVSDYVDARVCFGSNPAQQELFESPGSLYVVPTTSKLFSFAYLAAGLGAVVTGQTASGVPSSPGGSWKSAQLVKVSMTVRANESAATSFSAELQPENANGSVTCGTDLTSPGGNNVAPFGESWQVSPGEWEVRADGYDRLGDIGGYSAKGNMVPGHSYSYTYYAAAPAPAAAMYTMIWRHMIEFTPPAISDPYGNGSESATLNHVNISLNGHSLANYAVLGTGPIDVYNDIQRGITAAGWYTITDTATRAPGFALPNTVLSDKTTLSWRFYASPSWSQEAAGYWTADQVHNLSTANSAAPGSTTNVTIRPYRDSSNGNVPVPSDSVTGIQAWWSNDGVHWHPLTAVHNSSGWYVNVPNPASGDVSLRTEVHGSHGDTSTQTVFQAYAIS